MSPWKAPETYTATLDGPVTNLTWGKEAPAALVKVGFRHRGHLTAANHYVRHRALNQPACSLHCVRT